MTYPHHPRFGSNYRGLTNRLDVLLECYSYLPFEERVATASAWQHRAAALGGRPRRRHLRGGRREPAAAARGRRALPLEDFAAPVEILTRAPRTLDGAPDLTVHLPHRARFVGATSSTGRAPTRCRRRWPSTWRATA
jgi:hypothetical protein